MNYFDGISFVFEETARFGQMSFDELRTQSARDLLSSLPSAGAGSGRVCGVEAARTLQAIAGLAIQRSSFKGRIGEAEVAKNLAGEIVHRFLVSRQEFTVRNVDRAVASAVRKAAKNIRAITHFIPCLMFDDDEPAEFSIGNVKFEKRSRCFDRLQSAFDFYQKDCIGNGRPQWVLPRALGYYEGFNWIAEVTIDDCDPPTSRARAKQIVEVTLDFLHVVLGTKFSSRVRVGGPNMLVDIRGRFEISGGTVGDVLYSREPQTGYLADNWLSQLQSTAMAQLFPIIAKTVSEGLHTSNPAPFAQRLIDAARWYGDAARERFPASQLVKFVIAIERVLTTKKEKDITKTFCNRGSALICHPHKAKVESIHKRFSKVYAARSDFAHGSKSPFDAKFGAALEDAEELSRSVIGSALIFLDDYGRLYDRAMTDKQLDIGFERLVAWATS